MIDRKCLYGIAAWLALLILALPGFSQDKASESLWTKTPLTIDASAEDWSGQPLLADEDTGTELAFRNDADYLYLLLTVKDKEHLSTFDFTGMSVYFNTEGKKNKDRQLRFFKKMAKAEELIQALEKSGQTLSDEKKAELLSKKNYILYQCELIEGKKVSPVEALPGAQLLPPMFKVHTGGEKAFFKFRIPLDREKQAAGIGATPGGNLKVGFEWGGLTEQMKARRLAGMVAASEERPNPPQPSGYVDRGSQTHTDISSEMRKSSPKKYSFWLDVKLAKAEQP
jgi:hypothetical protein